MTKFLMVILLLVVTITAQDMNRTLIDSTSGKPILIGLSNREAFVDTNFSWWFDSGDKFYRPDTTAIAQLKEVSTNYTVTIVMGTWCSDSRREVPRFYKILDELDYSDENIKIINVDRDKVGIKNGVDSLNIELVPTFIIYTDDKEIGRIIETPNESLEKDMSKILITD